MYVPVVLSVSLSPECDIILSETNKNEPVLQNYTCDLDATKTSYLTRDGMQTIVQILVAREVHENGLNCQIKVLFIQIILSVHVWDIVSIVQTYLDT